MPTAFAKRFLWDEAGAVTVDWVVLTAGAMTLGVMAVANVIAGATNMSTGIGAQLDEAEPPGIDFTPLTPKQEGTP